jgi:hypothetical protein
MNDIQIGVIKKCFLKCEEGLKELSEKEIEKRFQESIRDEDGKEAMEMFEYLFDEYDKAMKM